MRSLAFSPFVRSNLVFRTFFLTLAVICGHTGIAQDTRSVAGKTPIGSVAGEAIYEDDLPARVLGQLRLERQHEYELAVRAIQELAGQKLLEAEARKQGLTTEELLAKEVDSKIGRPAPAEVEAFYLAQKDRNRSFEDVKPALAEDLKRAKIQAAREVYVRALQERSSFSILVARPRISVNYDSTRMKGAHGAPVIIVEFSDFDCPFCRQAELTLKRLASRYQGRVSFAYRDFPLREKHPQAEIAAEAGRCAGEQNKFWEYHDLLFENPSRRERVDLLQLADKVELDKKQFDSCFSSGKYKSQIEQDVKDGVSAGVSGTPAFFINGIFLAGALPASEFEKIIDEELQLASRESAQK